MKVATHSVSLPHLPLWEKVVALWFAQRGREKATDEGCWQDRRPSAPSRPSSDLALPATLLPQDGGARKIRSAIYEEP